jgi:hypothetical protein
VRVAVDTSTEVGNRSVRALLSEDSIEHVGVLNESVPRRKRSGPMTDLASYDVLVSDGTSDVHRLIGQCSVARIPLVLWHELDPTLQGPTSVPVVHGANIAVALTSALCAHRSASITDDDNVVVGWTEPGDPSRDGMALPFPEPVGNAWGVERAPGRYAAFRDDEWGGVVVDINGPTGRRILGVADHSAYVEAITLAGTAITAGKGHYEPGSSAASVASEQLLNTFTAMELEMAVWRPSP